MTLQFHDTLRNAWLSTYEATIGTSPKVRFYSGTKPANCAAAATGTMLVEIAAPSDWMNSASGGQSTKLGTWSATASATGTIGHYRVYNSAGTTCYEQGSVSQALSLTTSASTAAAGNVLTFTSTSGVTTGMSVVGTGVPSGATVLAVGATTVTLSAGCPSGVGSGVAIQFGDTTGDLYLALLAVTSGLTVVTVSVKTLIAPGA